MGFASIEEVTISSGHDVVVAVFMRERAAGSVDLAQKAGRPAE
jgi:hypothetical protein